MTDFFTTIEQREQIKQITNRREQTENILFIESNNNNKTNDGNSSEDDDELAKIHDNYLNSLIDAVSSVSIKEKDNEICETPENITIDSLKIDDINESRKNSIKKHKDSIKKRNSERKDNRKNKRKQPGPLQLPDPTIFKIKPPENVVEDEYVQELIDDVKYFYAPLIEQQSINTCLFEQEIKRLLYDLLESYYINYNTENKDKIYTAFNDVYDAMKQSQQYDMDSLSKFKTQIEELHKRKNTDNARPMAPTLYSDNEENQSKKQRTEYGGKKKRKTKKLKKKVKTKKSKMKKIKRKTMKKKKSKKHKR